MGMNFYGMNFYLHEQSPCPTCGREYDPLHIGKSSAGWCFALHVDPDAGIHDLPDWEARWAKPGALIQDEYGRPITPEDMRLIIMARARTRGSGMSEDWYRVNDATPGPGGLARNKLGRHCIGHGDGTWDLITGEFR